MSGASRSMDGPPQDDAPNTHRRPSRALIEESPTSKDVSSGKKTASRGVPSGKNPATKNISPTEYKRPNNNGAARKSVETRKSAENSGSGRQYHRQPGSWLKSVIVVGISLVIVLSAIFLARGKFMLLGGADYQGDGINPVTVTIDPGTSISQMGDLLVSENVVASRNAFVREAKRNPRSNAIQAGTYQLRTHMSAKAAVAILVDPSKIASDQVTIPEGLRNTQMFAHISQSTGISEAELTAASQDAAALGLPSYANGNSEGFLFPDTYPFTPRTTAAGLLRNMADRFNQVASDVDLVNGAARIHRSPRDVVIVASIIEKETVAPQYAPLVAEVMYNRLDKGMKLQSDATVSYANNVQGSVTTTDEQRALNSPYNTYVITGLPAGPIANPGRVALEAALKPASGDLLYFVTVNLDTGETKFAATQEEHDANVAQFQSWCQGHPGRCE